MEERFDRFFGEIVEDTGLEFKKETLENIKKNVLDYVESKEEMEAERFFDLIIRYSNDEVSEKTPELGWLSASSLRRKLYKQSSKNRGFNYKDGYGDYYSWVVQATEQGLYDSAILKKYSKEEIEEAGNYIVKDRDKLFSYPGLFMFDNTYLQKGYQNELLELPQERYITIALIMMQDEPKEKRMELVKESYWVNSSHYVGQPSPVVLHAGAPKGALASCQIITMDDDLVNIFDVVKQAAQFSQNSSGLGIFIGNLRSSGSWIRNFKGRASGIVHPSRLLSVLAEYINQMGLRPAGISVYLPIWHRDIKEFLDMRLKTGTQEKRAHSIKTAVTIPDEFMRRLKNKETFTLYDPYEFKKVMGVDLNRLYDNKKLKDNEVPNEEDHAFTYWYRKAEESNKFQLAKTMNATDIYKSIFIARKTTGTPYMYYLDTSARMNANPHKGMPMGSNLC